MVYIFQATIQDLTDYKRFLTNQLVAGEIPKYQATLLYKHALQEWSNFRINHDYYRNQAERYGFEDVKSLKRKIRKNNRLILIQSLFREKIRNNDIVLIQSIIRKRR